MNQLITPFRSLGIAAIAIVLAMLVGVMFNVHSAHAEVLSDLTYGGSPDKKITDYESAKRYVNDLCNTDSYRETVALAAYPSNVAFNTDTGAMTYTANLVWRSCPNRVGDGSQAFAVMGYPSTTNNGGEPATCPNAGTYAQPETYDCIKYIGSDRGVLKGYATLGCPQGSGYDCVTGRDDPNGLFRSSIENRDKEPTYDGNNPNTRSVSGLGGQVSDWGTRSRTSGTQPFGRSNAFCTYYKQNSDETARYGNCVSLLITVSWTRFNYNLTPTITAPSDNATVQSGYGSYNVNGNVANAGPTDSRPNAEWQLSQIVYRPGEAIPQRGGGDDGRAPCNFVQGGRCTSVNSGTESAGYSSSGSKNYLNAVNVGDYDVGTRLCYMMSVKPFSHTTGDWRHSKMSCLIVSKSPKVQIVGGDLIVGRGTTSGISTSTTRNGSSNTYYGSWSEYGILATGMVVGMASGSGYAGGSPTNDLCSATPRKLSVLTFANTDPGGSCTASNLGSYTNLGDGPAIASRFPVTSATPSLSGTADLTNGGAPLSGVYQSTAAALTVKSSGSIPDGRWVVINAKDTTVTIDSNITYTNGSLNSIGKIPQVVIIAKNIIIKDTVSQIDAWLVAVGTDTSTAKAGYINTCSVVTNLDNPTNLNAGNCSTKLTVNGPISANHLYLYRTAGSGNGSSAGDPSEVFNLRADAYIWASSYSPGTGRLPTVSTKELPPRF